MTAYWPAFNSRVSDSVTQSVEQMTHGFEVGEVVVFDGTDWVRSLADDYINCFGSWMVSNIIDVDNIEITSVGIVEDLTLQDPYNPGEIYVLSATNPGQLVPYTNKPNFVGQVIYPCFYAITNTSGQFFGGAGTVITSGMILNNESVNSNTKMVSNTSYTTTGAGAFNLELPDALDFFVGDVIEIYCDGTGQITITQPALVQTQIVEQSTTAGITGTLTLQLTGGAYKGSLILKCTTLGLVWSVIGGTGQWTPA